MQLLVRSRSSTHLMSGSADVSHILDEGVFNPQIPIWNSMLGRKIFESSFFPDLEIENYMGDIPG